MNFDILQCTYSTTSFNLLLFKIFIHSLTSYNFTHSSTFKVRQNWIANYETFIKKQLLACTKDELKWGSKKRFWIFNSNHSSKAKKFSVIRYFESNKDGIFQNTLLTYIEKIIIKVLILQPSYSAVRSKFVSQVLN